ncbi:MAG: tyrosine--tRNA ligase [Candidatus Kapaibacterium sp.]|nr:tyrosine--tRNA ligase [Ignavibacteriota bacterium]
MKFPSVNEQMDIIKSSAVDVLPEDELVRKLENSIKNKKQLIIKLGADPSRPDLHIGHAVVLNKMRQFQDLGHKAILIIGDFTAMIGDPSGKSKTRPQLTLEDTRVNGQSYLDQAGLILDESPEKFQVRYNSEWLNVMNFRDVVELAAKYTVAQLLERDDFNKRYNSGVPISMHELLYPLAQAMDSAEIESDVELGGTDQKFNLIVGRDIQRAYGKEPQCIVTLPILEGTDGKEKMSKSLDNYIALTDKPSEIFGKVMSIPDDVILRYYEYGAFATRPEIEDMAKFLANESNNPRDAKIKVAMRITDKYHESGSGQAAYEEFLRVFTKGDVPDEIEELELPISATESKIIDIITDSGMVDSKKDAKRMVQQGAVSVDDNKISDINESIDLTEYRIFKVGKRKFKKIKAK